MKSIRKPVLTPEQSQALAEELKAWLANWTQYPASRIESFAQCTDLVEEVYLVEVVAENEQGVSFTASYVVCKEGGRLMDVATTTYHGPHFVRAEAYETERREYAAKHLEEHRRETREDL